MRAVAHAAEVASSVAASSARAWRGTLVRHRVEPPAQLFRLFDMEGCPHCRPVREALSELDLDVEVYPCPKGGTRYRALAVKLAGVSSFPTLHDPSTGVVLVGKQAILDHLFERFDSRPTPQRFRGGMQSSRAATALRHLRGIWARPSRDTPILLELWSFESSPYSRLVRERLCELQLAYRLHNLGKEQTADIGLPWLRLTLSPYVPKPGGKREQLLRYGGKVQVPFLYDACEDVMLYESRDIIDHLERTYALPR